MKANIACRLIFALVLCALLASVATTTASAGNPGLTRVIVWLKSTGQTRLSYDGQMSRASNVARVNQTLRTAYDVRGQLIQSLTAGFGLRDVTPLWILEGRAFSARVDAATKQKLAQDSRVEKVMDDATIKLEPTSPKTEGGGYWNLDKVQATVTRNQGQTGQGAIVGVIDTGVNALHPELLDAGGNNKVVAFIDFVYANSAPYDTNGHGTHVSGTIVGNNTGVAPGAKLEMCAAFDSNGNGSVVAILNCMQWFIAPNGNPALAPDVINNSWGTNNGADMAYQQAFDSLNAAGIVSVVAAGNNGWGNPSSVDAPGSYPSVITVGATDSGDALAYFSGLGPSPIDGSKKPDVCAPGVDVKSSWKDGGYMTLSGTSMATPHMTGAVAILKAMKRDLTTQQIKALLPSSADHIFAGYPDNKCGWGRLNLAALAASLNGGTANVQILNSAGMYQSGINVTLSNGVTFVSSNGPTKLVLSPGTYSVVADSFLYKQNTATSPFTIVSGQETTVYVTMKLKDQGTVSGMVTAKDNGKTLAGIAFLEGTPVSGATGVDRKYNLTAPVGVYSLKFTPTDKRYQTATQTVTVKVNQKTTQDLVLDLYPIIPLVDGENGVSLVSDDSSLWHLVGQTDQCAPKPLNGAVPARSWYYGHFALDRHDCNYDTPGSKNSGGLSTPLFYVPADTDSPKVKFWSWMSTELYSYYDVGAVNVYADGQLVVSQEMADKSTGAWAYHEISLSGCLAKVCRVEFYFDTRDSAMNYSRGWYLTGVILAGRTAELKVVVSASDKVESCQKATTSIAVINEGESVAANVKLDVKTSADHPVTFGCGTGVNSVPLWQSSQDLGTLGPGESKVVPYEYFPSVTTQTKITTIASASTTTAEINKKDNTVSALTIVTAPTMYWFLPYVGKGMK